MIKVFKKNNTIEDFDIDKIKTSILNAGDDLNYKFNESDINLISHNVMKKIINNHPSTYRTNVYEIRCLIYSELIEFGCKDVAYSYMNMKI